MALRSSLMPVLYFLKATSFRKSSHNTNNSLQTHQNIWLKTFTDMCPQAHLRGSGQASCLASRVQEEWLPLFMCLCPVFLSSGRVSGLDRPVGWVSCFFEGVSNLLDSELTLCTRSSTGRCCTLSLWGALRESRFLCVTWQ